DANSVATFTESATSICQGGNILFDATGSTFEDTLLWYFPGGTPVISNSVTQSSIYNTPGSYSVILYVIGGGCHLFDSAFVNITVNPNPVISVSATSTSVCLPGSTTLTASGANTYVWSPSTGLSSTTTASTVSTPTATITYNVQGTTTATGCSSNSTIQIDVLSPPVASETESSTSICVGQSVVFDGSPSTDATTFAWSFPGGNPSSSNSSSATVTYAAAGSYNAVLVVTNSCGADTVVSQTIGVGCTGIDPMVITQPSLFFNTTDQELNITLPVSTSTYQLVIFDQLGNEVKSYATGKTSFQWGMAELASGVYFVQITNDKGRTVSRFVK
ncbi:MAG TPA: PKD domain-containing protein, partial [Bacteroidia bacterium]|nr:PKD domain-containing protein [Bacteroidia bacterium]